LIGLLLASLAFVVFWEPQWGPFLTIDWAGSHPARLILVLLCFLAFFFAGAAFLRGWRYQRFAQPPPVGS
jgi:hypothetical protein